MGLIGANIMGSLSPALFADAFAAAGVDGYYHLMDVDRLPGRRLAQLLDATKAAGFAGTNITFPFKQEIMPLLDVIDPQAVQVGAVNTVAIAPDGHATGYNFDRPGFRCSFEESLGQDSAKGATVVQVGAGGAGRAVAFAMMDLGVALLIIHDLDAVRANALKSDLTKHYDASRCRIANDLESEIAFADGVVNATQVGMRGFPGNPVPVSPLKTTHWAADGVVNATQVGMRGFPGNPVPVAPLKSTHWAADVIYTPIQTAFLDAAAAKGARVLNGGGLCVHQAVEAFRMFTGIEADVARMHRTFA
ncbi:MAG: hypothetical protein ACRECA_08670, partial [Pseudolabrys sp.]